VRHDESGDNEDELSCVIGGAREGNDAMYYIGVARIFSAGVHFSSPKSGDLF